MSNRINSFRYGALDKTEVTLWNDFEITFDHEDSDNIDYITYDSEEEAEMAFNVLLTVLKGEQVK